MTCSLRAPWKDHWCLMEPPPGDRLVSWPPLHSHQTTLTHRSGFLGLYVQRRPFLKADCWPRVQGTRINYLGLNEAILLWVIFGKFLTLLSPFSFIDSVTEAFLFLLNLQFNSLCFRKLKRDIFFSQRWLKSLDNPSPPSSLLSGTYSSKFDVCYSHAFLNTLLYMDIH